MNLYELLISNPMKSFGNKVAMIYAERSYTYQQIDQFIDQLSDYLLNNGIKPQDRVLLHMPNSVEYVVALLAITKIGAIAVPLDIHCGEERFRSIQKNTQAKLTLHRGTEGDSQEAQILIQNQKLEVNGKALTEKISPVTSVIEDSHPALIIYSSGSTGIPKGVVLQHNHLVATAKNLSSAMGFSNEHRELLISPMSHTDGWQRVASTLACGGTLVVYSEVLSVPHFIAALEKEKITGFYSSPAFLRYILLMSENRSSQLQGIKNLEVGSAQISSEEITKLKSLFANADIFVHFGLTESSRATLLHCQKNPDQIHTVGKAMQGVEIGIFDENQKPLSTDQVGEIYLRGVQTSNEYWNRKDLNESRFYKDWVKTGDYGSLNSQGFLTFQGRKDDMINYAGHHFFPAEVERELGPTPGLKKYMIAAAADPILGEICIVFCVLEDTAVWSNKTFFDFAKDRISNFKVPKKIIIVEDIIYTSSGKPDRKAMISRYWKGS